MLKIDDGFLGHRKADHISDRVLGFWVRSLLYVARNLTDGRLPASFVRTKTQMALCDDLLHRGLWEKTEHGYLVHDYLQWNDAKAVVESRRATNRLRQAAWRDRNAVSNVLGDKDRNGPDRYLSEGQGVGQGVVDPAEARRREIERALG